MKEYNRKKEFNEVKEKHLKALKLFLKQHNEHINERQNRD
jgi:hypothetical protein